ncbi:cytochrome P450 [Neoconidiobolus thromboides FSU 785]|nr:cytochrome P450 [Neoconidiobolus thromboides FSU 785]
MILYILLSTILSFSYIYFKLRLNKNVSQLPSVSTLMMLYHILLQTSGQLRDELLINPLFSKNRFISIFLGRWFILVKDMDIIKKILLNDETFVKINQNEMMNDFGLIRENIAEVDKKKWKVHKKVVNPAFKRGWDLEIFITVANKICDKIQNASNQEIEVMEIFKAGTLDSLGLAVFDIDFNTIGNQDNEMAHLYNNLMNEILNPLFLMLPFLNYFPFPSRMKLYSDTAKFRSYIKGLVDDERKKLAVSNDNEKGSNLLSLMIQSSDDELEGLTDELIINNAIIFFIAGHDTTAHTLTSAIYYLAKYPEIQYKLRQEIKDVLGPKGTLKDLNLNQTILNEIVYLDAIIYETLRSIPVVPILSRKPNRPVTLESNLVVDTNQSIMLHLGLAMKDPVLFKNPEEFEPERFLMTEDNKTKINKKMTSLLLTFGYGARMCLGNQFSLLEQKVFLIALLLEFNVSLPENSPHYNYPILPSLGLFSPKDLKVKFTKI